MTPTPAVGEDEGVNLVTEYTARPVEGTGVKANVQRFGAFLSSMVMPNIAAFIAWGLVTAIFIDVGWFPVAEIGGFDGNTGLVEPMLYYLLPILIGYTGGRVIHGTRGGVVGAIATIGVIVGTNIPMFLGAMAIGPLTAWLMKKFDGFIEKHTPAGFEMLINNFSAGILGGGMAIFGLKAMGPIVEVLVGWVGNGVQWLIDHSLLPLVSVIVEPAKVLFLNNALNHGIFTPLGSEQVAEAGRSILFMVESNPGPGLGVLLAYMVFGPHSMRPTTPAAVVVHLFGGIHEIYFPYVLMKPVLLLATISGGAAGILTGLITNAGLVGPAAPGSIIAWFAMTPRGGYIPMILTFLVATGVSMLVASALFKFGRGQNDLDVEAEAEAAEDAAAQAARQEVEDSAAAGNA